MGFIEKITNAVADKQEYGVDLRKSLTAIYREAKEEKELGKINTGQVREIKRLIIEELRMAG